MAVLRVGDWVKVGIDGCEGFGCVTLLNFNPKAHLVQLVDGSMPFAVLRSEDLLEPIDPAFNVLLTSVNK
jgi:hypothetical protein